MKNFPNQVKGESNIITLPGMMTAKLAEEFSAESQSWLLLPCTEHVFDFNNVFTLELGICPAIGVFQRLLKANGKVLRSINIKTSLMKRIETDGIGKVLGIEPKAAEPAKAKIDVGFINPFLVAALQIFDVQTQTKFTAGKPSVQNAGQSLTDGIVGIIALNGARYRGNIALCFPKDVFLKVYERMLGEKHTEITADIEDAAAELLNMIYGQSKTVWNSSGYEFQPAIPTILRGEKISVRQQTGGPVIVLPFSGDVGSFYVEIATQPVEDTKARSA